MDIADLPAGGLKEIVALVPVDGGQFGQSRCKQMDRVAGQLRIGNMTLYPFDGEFATECASATVFHHVPNALDCRGFTHDAPIKLFISRLQPLHHFHSAIYRGAFFIAGEQKGDGKPRKGFLS